MRLPPLIHSLTPVGQTLDALEGELALLTADARTRNDQTVVATAEPGLPLWEADFALPATGTTEARRERIRGALQGRNTLSAEVWSQLAALVGGADRGEVEEDFAHNGVDLYAVFEKREAEDLAALRELIARLAPAHLQVKVLERVLWEMIMVRQNPAPSPARGGWDGACAAGPAYAVFAGGMHPALYNMYNTVNAYDEGGTHITPGYLETARFLLGGARAGDCVLFPGGSTSRNYSSDFYATVDGYDEELAHFSVDPLSLARGWPVGQTIRDCALFAGGYNNSYLAVVDLYDEDLTHTLPQELANGRREFNSARTPNYALFAGGAYRYSTKLASVEAYDKDFTRLAAEDMSIVRSHISAAEAGGYALFAGGYYATSAVTDRVDAYDDTLTRTTAPAMHATVLNAGGGSLGEYAIFAGGWDTVANLKTVNVYDANLCHTMGEEVSVASSGYLSATVGNTAYFSVTSYPVTEVFKLIPNMKGDNT